VPRRRARRGSRTGGSSDLGDDSGFRAVRAEDAPAPKAESHPKVT
jgi:hypothetical protein